MFKSTHEKELDDWKGHYDRRLRSILIDRNFYQEQYNSLRKEWNTLVNRINKLGGEQFLEQSAESSQSTQFTDQELKRLVQLCHPDKHGNSQLSVEMTQKLNRLRK
jgi:hypothetical protein